ncbi:CBS domain-containing protein [Thermospira aquatica]|uniref:CBS domain-containing protein n=1 Tax=Thermospira aquatica TaxID=2828656 RepID=A0AAX3BCR8_9SPIR|nr:CBS domain-containing protein [Thermospira aquatica]URA10094.1 CBS domain-containing protein [Thermospira aquatica]
MLFSSFLHPELYWIQTEIKNEEELLNQMVRGISREFSLSMTDKEIVDRILQRELEKPTLVGDCFWVPHFRIPDLEDLIIAISFLKKPISMGEHNVQMVFLVLTGPTRSTLYLNALSVIASLVQDSDFCQLMKKTPDFERFCHFLDSKNLRVGKVLTVADIMSTDIHVLRENQNLEEVLDIFSKHQLSYAPVVDTQERFVAEINLIDIMKVGMPAYTAALPNMNFLSSFEPFEELLKHEKDILVKQIMRKPHVILKPDASLVEAIFEFTNHRRRHLPVAKDGKILGVVSYMDMLNKVLRR